MGLSIKNEHFAAIGYDFLPPHVLKARPEPPICLKWGFSVVIDRKPLLALCSIGKFVFSHEDALRQKNAVRAKLVEWGVKFVDLEGLIPDGLVTGQGQVDQIVEHFRAQDVDALFVPHCNFGTEGAVGMIARKLGVPTLVWGPRDEAPLEDGTRLRDTLCGLYASTGVLRKLGVPFSYIENCRIDDPALRDGLDKFLRAAAVAELFRNGVRVGAIGSRIDFFWTTIINEAELLQRFKVEVQPVDMVEFIRDAKQRATTGRTAYLDEAGRLRESAIIEDLSDEALINIFAVRDQMLTLAADYGLEGIAIRDFMSIVQEMGAWCCFSCSQVADTLAIGFELDLLGALSDIIIRRATLGEGVGYLAEFVGRHPTNDNAGLLWHAGAPLSMRNPESKVRLGDHWILKSAYSGMTHFPLKNGPITVTRFEADHGDYLLGIGEGHTTEGPATLNNYAWMEVEDWARWERKLMEGPYIHHLAIAYGRYGAALQEACKFIPGLKPDLL